MERSCFRMLTQVSGVGAKVAIAILSSLTADQVAFAIMAVGTFAIALFPSMSVPLFVALCALVYVGMYCNYGIVFSLMDDGGIPMEVSGTAVGVICTIGYLPEVVCPATAGIILDTFTEAGYKYYFLAVGIIMLIGIVGIMIWNRSMKKQKALNK